MAVQPTEEEVAERKTKEKNQQTLAEKERLSKIKDMKVLRYSMQEVIELLQSMWNSREISLAITKFQEGKMWLGQELGNLGAKDLNAERDAKETSKEVENSRTQ